MKFYQQMTIEKLHITDFHDQKHYDIIVKSTVEHIYVILFCVVQIYKWVIA